MVTYTFYFIHVCTYMCIYTNIYIYIKYTCVCIYSSFVILKKSKHVFRIVSDVLHCESTVKYFYRHMDVLTSCLFFFFFTFHVEVFFYAWNHWPFVFFFVFWSTFPKTLLVIYFPEAGYCDRHDHVHIDYVCFGCTDAPFNSI